jgi:hypothetical protein
MNWYNRSSESLFNDADSILSKSAQGNWLGRIRDRIFVGDKEKKQIEENTKYNLELAGKKQEEEDSKRAIQLMREYATKDRLGADNLLFTNKLDLTIENISKVSNMSKYQLQMILCGSFQNCSPFASEEAAERGKVTSFVAYMARHDGGTRQKLVGIERIMHSILADLAQAGGIVSRGSSFDQQEIGINNSSAMINLKKIFNSKDGMQKIRETVKNLLLDLFDKKGRAYFSEQDYMEYLKLFTKRLLTETENSENNLLALTVLVGTNAKKSNTITDHLWSAFEEEMRSGRINKHEMKGNPSDNDSFVEVTTAFKTPDGLTKSPTDWNWDNWDTGTSQSLRGPSVHNILFKGFYVKKQDIKDFIKKFTEDIMGMDLTSMAHYAVKHLSGRREFLWQEMARKYFPEDKIIFSDGLHKGFYTFGSAIYDNNRALLPVYGKWDINKIMEILNDIKKINDLSAKSNVGIPTAYNIEAKDVYTRVVEKLALIETVVRYDPILGAIFKIKANATGGNEFADRYYRAYSEIMSSEDSGLKLFSGTVNQIIVNEYAPLTYRRSGYPLLRVNDEELDVNKIFEIGEMTPFSALLSTVALGDDAYRNMHYRLFEPEKMKILAEEVRKNMLQAKTKSLEDIRKIILKGDIQLDEDDNRELAEKMIKKMPSRDFSEAESRKAKEEKIVKSPFEHTSAIYLSDFPGRGFFHTENIKSIGRNPQSFSIVLYPKIKEGDPADFTEVLKPNVDFETTRGGLNFHHLGIKTIEKEGYYSNMLGWIGGWINPLKKSIYVAEIQSDIMQHTGFMRDPEKSRANLNEDWREKTEELRIEKENLQNQSQEGTDAYYDNKIAELEKKKSKAKDEEGRSKIDIAIKNLLSKKQAKEDPWEKSRKKIENIEKIIKEIEHQISKLDEYEANTKLPWRRRPQFANVRSKIENRFSDYIDVMYNELFAYCSKLGIKHLWIAHSKYLARVWEKYIEPETVEMYKKIYDEKAKSFGGQEAEDWFYIDLEESMPKFARSNWYREAKNGMV